MRISRSLHSARPLSVISELEARVDGRLIIALFAHNSGERSEAVGVECSDGVTVVCLHEDKGPGLQLCDTGDRAAELSGAGSSSRDYLDVETFFANASAVSVSVFIDSRHCCLQSFGSGRYCRWPSYP